MPPEADKLRLVPELSRVARDTADRLRGLDALTEHLSRDESDQFRAYMLGALAAVVDQVEWERALGNAMEWSNTWLRTTGGKAATDEKADPFS